MSYETRSYGSLLKTGTHDAMVDGVHVTEIPNRTVYISSSEEKDELADKLLPGTYVALYGLSHIWQLNDSGTYETII